MTGVSILRNLFFEIKEESGKGDGKKKRRGGKEKVRGSTEGGSEGGRERGGEGREGRMKGRGKGNDAHEG
jgi:hypothetical protein